MVSLTVNCCHGYLLLTSFKVEFLFLSTVDGVCVGTFELQRTKKIKIHYSLVLARESTSWGAGLTSE